MEIESLRPLVASSLRSAATAQGPRLSKSLISTDSLYNLYRYGDRHELSERGEGVERERERERERKLNCVCLWFGVMRGGGGCVLLCSSISSSTVHK